MNHKAFTLIELLVVVAIIGILAAVGVVAYNGYTGAAKASATQSNHKLVSNYIQNSIDSEYVLHCSNSGYPSSKLNNSQAAGYIFITNVSGSPKTMRLAMRWDNDYSGNWSQRYSRNDITTP